MRVTGTRLNLSPSSWGGLLDNAVSVTPFIRTADVLRASFEEHRLRRLATVPPKTLPQERMDEGTHWIDDQPQQRRLPERDHRYRGLLGPAIRLQKWEQFEIFTILIL